MKATAALLKSGINALIRKLPVHCAELDDGEQAQNKNLSANIGKTSSTLMGLRTAFYTKQNMMQYV